MKMGSMETPTVSRKDLWKNRIVSCRSFGELKTVGKDIYKEMLPLLEENSKLNPFHQYSADRPKIEGGALRQTEVLEVLSALLHHPENTEKNDIAPFRSLASEFGIGH